MFYIKRFFKHLWDFLSWALKWIIAIIFVALILGGIYIGYNDIQATKAKDYLVEKYNMDKYKLYAYKTTEFVYEENTDCSTLWFKKCTDDVNQYKKITFIFLDKKDIKKKQHKIHVVETRDGEFSDDYKGDSK